MEYLVYLLDCVSKSAHKEKTLNPHSLFSYETETIIRCNTSKKIRSSVNKESHLAIPINFDLMTNREEHTAYKSQLENGEIAKVRSYYGALDIINSHL